MDLTPLENTYTVIMAGGRGTRFWPQSRSKHPKQFLSLINQETLLQSTFSRLQGLVPIENIFVVTTEDLVALTQQDLPQLLSKNIIVEPEGRNTAPCVALTLVELEHRGLKGTMIVLSADHWVEDPILFQSNLREAVRYAEKNPTLVVCGIKPTHPETGYGYIETESTEVISKVTRFIEKPPLSKAIELIKDPHQFWNAGIFIWDMRVLRDEFEKHSPTMIQALTDWRKLKESPQTLKGVYAQLTASPIDIEILERSSNVAMIAASFRWSDVGSWLAASTFVSKDKDGNHIQGSGVLIDCTNTTVYGGERMVAASGIKDLIIVDTPDALLICHRNDVQSVKQIVEKLHQMNRKDLL